MRYVRQNMPRVLHDPRRWLRADRFRVVQHLRAVHRHLSHAGAFVERRAPATLYEPARMPKPEQLDELFKERRNVRDFKRDKIELALIDEIVSRGIYAPTHHFHLRAVVTQDDAVIEEIDRTMFRFSSMLYRFFYRPRFMPGLIRLFAPAFESDYRKARPKLEQGQARGSAFRSRPAAFVFIVGDRRTPLGDLSAQYALYNMTLYAQTHGLGCQNLVGNQMAINRDRAMRRRLGLGKHERILGMFGMGYPAVKFMNRVEGKTMPIEWIHE